MRRVDLRGCDQECAHPGVRLAFETLSSAGKGERVEVVCDNADHLFALRAYARQHNHRILDERAEGNARLLVVERGESA